jgi:hypothetical protein
MNILWRTYEMEFSKGSPAKAPRDFLISFWGLLNLPRLQIKYIPIFLNFKGELLC